MFALGQRIVKADIADKRPWKACLILLNACHQVRSVLAAVNIRFILVPQRQGDQHWAPPTNFAHSLRELRTRADQASGGGVQDLTKQVLKIIEVRWFFFFRRF